jgi:hypothetical protein
MRALTVHLDRGRGGRRSRCRSSQDFIRPADFLAEHFTCYADNVARAECRRQMPGNDLVLSLLP